MKDTSASYDHFVYKCKRGRSKVRRSGEIKKQQSLINVELVGSAKLSGIGFTALQELFRTLEMPIMSSNTFYELANRWIYPVFVRQFIRLRTEIITELRVTKKTGTLRTCAVRFFGFFCKIFYILYIILS